MHGQMQRGADPEKTRTENLFKKASRYGAVSEAATLFSDLGEYRPRCEGSDQTVPRDWRHGVRRSEGDRGHGAAGLRRGPAKGRALRPEKVNETNFSTA